MHIELYNKRNVAEFGKALRALNVDFEIKRCGGYTGTGLKFNIAITPFDFELSQRIQQLASTFDGIKKS